MVFFDLLQQMRVRFRYPVSLPQDVALSLGITLTNHMPFQQLLSVCRHCQPTRLAKYMSRMDAESAFQCAHRKERFLLNSLYSFYFNEGWLEFELQFDDLSRLRRVYLHHKLILDPRGYELNLPIDETALLDPQNESPDSLYIA